MRINQDRKPFIETEDLNPFGFKTCLACTGLAYLVSESLEDFLHILPPRSMGIIESENKEQALLVVPPNLRSKTRVVKLVSYDRSS